MASLLLVFPLKKRQANAARTFVRGAASEHYNEYVALAHQLGLQDTRWFLLPPDRLVLLVGAADLAGSIGGLFESQEPFARWMKDQLHDLTGLDLDKGLPTDQYAETLAEVLVAPSG
jgi:hypothetical protein